MADPSPTKPTDSKAGENTTRETKTAINKAAAKAQAPSDAGAAKTGEAGAAKRLAKAATPQFPTKAAPPETAQPESAKIAPPKAAAPAAADPIPLADLVRTLDAPALQTLSRSMGEAMTRANNAFSTAFQDQSRANMPMKTDPFDVQGALNEAWRAAASNPDGLRESHGQLWKRYADIWERHAARMMGLDLNPPGAEATRDKRFRDAEWRTNPGFSLMRETYLATAEWITGLIGAVEGLDEATKRKAQFFIKQAVDAASPSNFLMTNPAALRAAIESRGESVLKGISNLEDDLKRGGGVLAIRQADLDAFRIGENIATTPGKVVFRNRLIELIQYTPTTDKVFQVPLLIFPPWINKFYIMDLQPKNSLIRWLTAQGHTVFVASWVNPDAKLAECSFEDYMQDGVFAAVGAVQEAITVDRMNTVGYCIGGTLLASTLAVMAKQKDKRIQSATFFAAQTDFKLAGELLVFADDPGLDYLEQRIDAKGGLLDAQAMADTFNSLRSNDLIWNYVVENYYMGNQPPPFDLLYWNSDQTRMPKALHLYYMKNFYRDNALAEGKLTAMGEALNLKDVKIPIYMQSSKEDHIAPFGSVYRGARLFGGPVRFMMAGSGHIAGVINHPDAKKYQYWVNKHLPPTVQEWIDEAVEHPGSWWPDWHAWLSEISGDMVPARKPGEGGLPALDDAPGTYVKIKSQ
jgi:polyhydroxyalkanoate synthase